MASIPLFILAGCDKNDEFGRRRIFEFKVGGKLILEYQIEEAKKADCFSEIFLVGDKGLRDIFSQRCFFIEAKDRLWKNLKIIYNFVKSRYNDSIIQIAVLLSDVFPSSKDLRDIFLQCQQFFDKDVILLATPSGNLRKRRGKHFLRKDEKSSSEPYSGTGGFYILRPMKINKNLSYYLASLRMPRDVRKVEVFQKKIYIKALKSMKGLIFFFWQIFKIIFCSLLFLNKIYLFIKMFLRHQHRELTFGEAEIFLSKILIKKKYLRSNTPSVRLEVVNNPVFVEDIDGEEDLKILDPRSC